jgi:hypothetical protein
MGRRWMALDFIACNNYTSVWIIHSDGRRYPQSYPQRGLSPRQRCGIFISADLGGEAEDLEGCGSLSSLPTPETPLLTYSRHWHSGEIALQMPPGRYALNVRLTALLRNRGVISRGIGECRQLVRRPFRHGNRIVRSSGKTWTAGKAPTVTCLVRSGFNED